MADAGVDDGLWSARDFTATYRLQLRAGMDLDRAAGLLDYLSDLGISHAYLSPVLAARTDSTHGYDVTDPTRVDRALGGDDAFARFSRAAHRHRLGVVVDLVPNHMAADSDENLWWRDVLANGRASAYARHFDIVWDPPDRKLRNQILLPILDDHYGRVLERGELRLDRVADGLVVQYHERSFPVEARSSAGLWERAARAAGDDQLLLVARVFASLDSPLADGPGPADSFRGRRADLEVGRKALAATLESDGDTRAAVDAELARLNTDCGALHDVLDAQCYRLARWQTGAQEVDYRRFFDVTDLVGVRIEDPDVFAEANTLVRGWVDEGLVDGFRVDHPDGLAEPARYCADLRGLIGNRWLVVEKILERDEALPDWPVDGTTGYEFSAAVNRLFVADAGYATLHAATVERVAPATDFAAEVVVPAKLETLANDLNAELRRLVDRAAAVCEEQPRFRDFSRQELREALAASVAWLSVYRSYVSRSGQASTQDRSVVEQMVADAAKSRPDLDPDLFALVGGALMGDAPFTGPGVAVLRQRFQQLSGAVMAKGKEDTALYRFPVLLSANEVGADPGHASSPSSELHALAAIMASEHPRGMVSLSTHDTKRSEDVRARLNVLSEMPETYLTALDRFLAIHSDWGEVEPDRNWMAMCFQTLVGAHPLSKDRLQAYAEKATREAGVRTSWRQPDEAFEEAVRAMTARAVDDPVSARLVSDLVDEIRLDGRVNALAQRLLLLTAAGTPDLYQGSELWDLSLVDPDNRRPVDFDRRVRLLAEGHWGDPTRPMPGWDVLADPADPGIPKLAMTVRALSVRRRHPDAFGPTGTYRALEASGPAADHVFVFARDDEVVVAVSRFDRSRRRCFGGWPDTTLELPDGTWHDALTPGRALDGTVAVSQLFASTPVALLHRDPVEGAAP